ncbi:MAG: ATP-binding protein [Cyanobacteria bacterium P01_G01_bin.54]
MVDIRAFYHNTNPRKTLDLARPEDQALYIDFSALRQQDPIAPLQAGISFFSPDEPTCQLFTGHIGCGKSTELSRLKTGLEAENFHVVSFAASDDLEMGDVDVGDILLAIARQISLSLEAAGVQVKATGFHAFLRSMNQFLNQEVTGLAVNVPGFGEVGFNEQDQSLSLAMGIGKITAQTKNSLALRTRLRDYLEPRTKGIIDAINTELIEPAIAQLKAQGKAGLAVIVDNLDRVEDALKPFGVRQQNYLFVERGDQLRQLNCHVVYTIPLNLCFSGEITRLAQRFGNPYVLQVIAVENRDGTVNQAGIAKLKELVLVRAFPELAVAEREGAIGQLFDSEEALNQLCLMSGGHVRELLMLIQTWVMGERTTPLTRAGLDAAIRAQRNQLLKSIDPEDWPQLRQVHRSQQLSGKECYQTLLRSLLVYEYCDQAGSWFVVNPMLRGVKELQDR